MFLSEKVSLRLKRVYMGVAIWLLYTSYLIISSAMNTHTPLSSAQFVLTPIAMGQK
ncbi:hypothetical protein [Polynucleobacter necessarius]|uniref:hypothetical protein n=1 Tax=Polynucleobacter necessarius TaxID=576610 RepID=UPI0015584EAF|nr:hypothetical protein [Polynucleobacter necessarius]